MPRATLVALAVLGTPVAPGAGANRDARRGDGGPRPHVWRVTRRALRRARSVSGRARRAAVHGRVTRAIRLGRVVTSAPRFVLVEGVLRDGRARRWPLRSGVGTVVMRSGGRDLDILEEIFASREYDPPPEVTDLLRRRSRPHVVDLGGNIGLFALRMFELLPGCTVASFEPDPDNLALLERCRRVSGLEGRWTIHAAAAGTKDGSADFLGGREADSRLIAPGHGTLLVPVRDAFDHFHGCDLLKIDIEGGEWEIVSDERFAAVPAVAVVMEFHGYRRPHRDIRGAAGELLSRCGYEVRHVAWDPVGVGRVWAWRADG